MRPRKEQNISHKYLYIVQYIHSDNRYYSSPVKLKCMSEIVFSGEQTSNFVDVLQGQSQRLVGWPCGWQDGVKCFEQSLPGRVSLFPLDAPPLEPVHVS